MWEKFSKREEKAFYAKDQKSETAFCAKPEVNSDPLLWLTYF